ncbi:uncharacterized protein SRS1_11102 [Sporisorium reilianum f. sp. reilianum]|uniref:Uncharacterized protein n=1 Tax=Sporisorium reilianum f. sp. reilianum TaxID=72559 RepID=A0A2N8UEM0_9BASI|nr:uncharacterized protein SRS1_11102 [Sporisorium reilianum f. sp. reilianum]
MKLTTLLLSLATVLAGTQAATIDHAGAWTAIPHRNEVSHFRIYAEPHGADLCHAKPVYDRCTFSSIAAKKHDHKKWSQPGGILEFQKLGKKTIGINCPDCTPQELGNLYQTDLYMNCEVLDHRSADWKPKGGK